MGQREEVAVTAPEHRQRRPMLGDAGGVCRPVDPDRQTRDDRRSLSRQGSGNARGHPTAVVGRTAGADHRDGRGRREHRRVSPDEQHVRRHLDCQEPSRESRVLQGHDDEALATDGFEDIVPACGMLDDPSSEVSRNPGDFPFTLRTSPGGQRGSPATASGHRKNPSPTAEPAEETAERHGTQSVDRCEHRPRIALLEKRATLRPQGLPGHRYGRSTVRSHFPRHEAVATHAEHPSAREPLSGHTRRRAVPRGFLEAGPVDALRLCEVGDGAGHSEQPFRTTGRQPLEL